MLRLATSLALFGAGSAELSGPEVQLPIGRLVGNQRDEHREFLGVPFAAPPVRWLPPVPAEPWQGVRSAKQVAPDCVRGGSWYTLTPEMSEDCLYLNLWAPPAAVVAKQAVPVMVWIFGGAYMTGSASDLQTRGDQLVRQHQDVIVVAGNYRLGVLGFLGSEEHREYVYRRTGLNTTGNSGFLDQVMLLKWIQQNVAAFGGNPHRVMLFGESAGAGAVSAHVASPFSAGLFHSAALQSGAFAEWQAVGMDHATDNYVALVKTMRKLKHLYPNRTWAEKWHCKPKLSDADCLLDSGIPGLKLVNQLAEADEYEFEVPSDWDGLDQSQWGPTVDGVVLKKQPLHAVLAGEFNAVPMIMGMNKDEGTEFLDGCNNGEDDFGNPACNMNYHLYNHLYNYFYPSNFSRDKIDDPKCFQDPLYKRWIGLNFGEENIDTLYEMYNTQSGSSFATNFWAAETLVGDMVIYCSARRAADVLAERVPVFEYYFARTPSESPFIEAGKTVFDDGAEDYIVDGFGACHGCEVPFVFYRNDSQEFGVEGLGESRLAQAVSSYWTNLAWSGDANDGGERWSKSVLTPQRWPTPAGKAGLLVFDASDSDANIQAPEAHPRGDVCGKFWNGYFEQSGWFPSEHGELKAARRSRWIQHAGRQARRSQRPVADLEEDFLEGNKSWRVCFRNTEEAEFVV